MFLLVLGKNWGRTINWEGWEFIFYWKTIYKRFLKKGQIFETFWKNYGWEKL